MNRHFRGAPPRLHSAGFDRSHQEFLGLPIVGAHLTAGLRVSVVRLEMDCVVLQSLLAVREPIGSRLCLQQYGAERV